MNSLICTDPAHSFHAHVLALSCVCYYVTLIAQISVYVGRMCGCMHGLASEIDHLELLAGEREGT